MNILRRQNIMKSMKTETPPLAGRRLVFIEIWLHLQIFKDERVNYSVISFLVLFCPS